MAILRKQSKQENEAKAQMDALAKALGYAKAIFAIDNMHGGNYVIQFMTNNKDSFFSYETLHCCKDRKHIAFIEDLSFMNNSWKSAVQIIERKCQCGYCIDVFCDTFNGFIHALKEHETIDEALIRLDLDNAKE